MTFQRVRVTDAFETLLNLGLAGNDPVGVVDAPAGVTDQAGKLRRQHVIIDPIGGAANASVSEEQAFAGLEYQVTSISTTRKGAEWLADAVRATVLDRQWPTGPHRYPMAPVTGYVVDRSASLLGGVSKDAPGTYTVVDSYILVVT